jgi:hypothetical protein
MLGTGHENPLLLPPPPPSPTLSLLMGSDDVGHVGAIESRPFIFESLSCIALCFASSSVGRVTFFPDASRLSSSRRSLAQSRRSRASASRPLAGEGPEHSWS